MTLGAHWLARNDALPWTLAPGAALDPVHATRREEFAWVRATLAPLRRGVVLDAGTGFAVGAHMLPYILAADRWTVMAVDADPRTATMPPRDYILRAVGDIRDLWWVPDGSLPVWVCVSVLEHLDADSQRAVLREAWRVLRPGGLLVLTMDVVPPSMLTSWLEPFGFLCGPADDTASAELTVPPVAAIAAVKPA